MSLDAFADGTCKEDGLVGGPVCLDRPAQGSALW